MLARFLIVFLTCYNQESWTAIFFVSSLCFCPSFRWDCFSIFVINATLAGFSLSFFLLSFFFIKAARRFISLKRVKALFLMKYRIWRIGSYRFFFLVGLPGSDYAGGALAFVCGVGFLLGAFIRPADLIANMTLYEDIRLLFTHELFFFLSLLSLFTYRSFLGKDYWSFVMTMFFFLLYFLLLRYRVIFPKEDFSSYSIALRVMDGSLVNYLIPDASLTWRILFASFCIGLIFLVPWLLLLLNQAWFRQEIKKGKVKERDVPLEHRYGLIPWLQRKKCESKIIPFSR